MKPYLTAIGIFIAITLWMLTGVFKSSTPEEATQASSEKARLTSVRVKTFQAQDKLISIQLNGKTQVKRVVDLKAEISGLLVSTPVEKGQRIKKGTLICQLADEDRLAQLQTAQANLKKAQLDYDGNKKLFDKGLLSSASLAASKAALESSQANLSRAELNVQYLKMLAPFDAFVEDRPAEVGSLMERGQECARLVDESTILAVAQADEKQIQQLSLKQEASVQLVSGQIENAQVSFLGRMADAETRTYRVEVTLLSPQQPIRDGLTASITIPIHQVKAQHISPSVMALNDKGVIYVRTLNDKNQVLESPIHVVAEDIGGVWVTGLGEKSRVIVVGQELVSVGETVNPVAVD